MPEEAACARLAAGFASVADVRLTGTNRAGAFAAAARGGLRQDGGVGGGGQGDRGVAELVLHDLQVRPARRTNWARVAAPCRSPCIATGGTSSRAVIHCRFLRATDPGQQFRNPTCLFRDHLRHCVLNAVRASDAQARGRAWGKVTRTVRHPGRQHADQAEGGRTSLPYDARAGDNRWHRNSEGPRSHRGCSRFRQPGGR